jgi:Domain of unknown function (DUF4160)
VPTIVELNGYAVRIFTRDHGNPHVHVFHDGALMKIWLSPPTFDSHKGRKPRKTEVNEALRIVAQYHGLCIKRWEELYG